MLPNCQEESNRTDACIWTLQYDLSKQAFAKCSALPLILNNNRLDLKTAKAKIEKLPPMLSLFPSILWVPEAFLENTGLDWIEWWEQISTNIREKFPNGKTVHE